MAQQVDEKVSTLNPFPGLRPFKIEESHLFFGREGQSDEVLLKLSKSRFVGVIGPSGSGKSSFIYCGVLPILYGGFLTDASPNWEVVVTRPGAGPIDNLAESLLKNNKEYLDADPEEKKIKRTIFSTLLRSSSLGLVEAVEQSRRSGDVNYLILVDQFEELFRFKDSTDPNSVNETLAFVNLLIEAINYPDSPIYVAITMRSDFIGDCAQFPELTRKINDSHYLIPQLTREQKRRAIEGPVAVGGAKITPRLVQQLLNDLGDNPDQLPILQHALMRTWSYWSLYRDYEEEQVDLKHYEAIGTMAEALSMHANEAFDELTDDQKRICEILFKAITEKRGENFGIRRPTRLNEIAAIADCSEEEVTEVIEKFREPGRSLLTPAFGTPISSKSMVDISHESLMRIWVRLKNWVDDEAEAVQMYIRLAEAASMYQVGKAGLWRPPDLQLALNWQAKHKPTLVWGQRYHPAFERTLVFLEYSKKEFETEQRIKELEQKRKLQRARRTALVLATATIISILFLIYAFVQKLEADRNFKLAEERRVESDKLRVEADKQRIAAVAAKEEADRQRIAAVAAKEEADRQKQLAILSEAEAKKQEAEALKQKGFAEQNAKIAKSNELQAKENERQANIARADATRRSYLSQAKAMALKSKELSSEPELQSLLAQQAYQFNTKYEGEEYDDDIYNGLLAALRTRDHGLTKSLIGHELGAARALITLAKDDNIYSGGSDGKIIKWKHVNGQWPAEVLVDKLGNPNYQVYSMDVNPSETVLVAAGLYTPDEQNNFINVYDLKNVSTPKKVYGFTNSIENVHFTPDGKGVYVRDNAGRSIKYSDLNTAKEVIKPPVKINSIDLSYDGRKLAGAGEDGILYIWDITNNYAVTQINLRTRANTHLTAVAWHPKAEQLITGDTDGLLRIVSTVSNTVIKNLPGHEGPIEQIKYNHGASFFASASKDKSVRLWNLLKLNVQPIQLKGHGDWVWAIAFTPNDEQLMVGLQSARQVIKRSATEDRIFTANEESIWAYPTKINTMANILCAEFIKRNMTDEEWITHVGKLDEMPKEKTCSNIK
ncbi:MAG: High-affnity carbon uptake protein Hat/HatR [Cyclobacteriaceae bacterium]|nr:High-affnity carbon uptake protein Hat/HatR [Cyclobacteriaceae bacterium]